jgi:hypothetical protein
MGIKEHHYYRKNFPNCRCWSVYFSAMTGKKQIILWFCSMRFFTDKKEGFILEGENGL